jgi:hypothetical protein
MSRDLSHETVADMLVALVEELEQRVSLWPRQRNVVVTALAIAANNGRVIGMNEAIAQAVQDGIDLGVNLTEGEQVPATLAEALG